MTIRFHPSFSTLRTCRAYPGLYSLHVLVVVCGDIRHLLDNLQCGERGLPSRFRDMQKTSMTRTSRTFSAKEKQCLIDRRVIRALIAAPSCCSQSCRTAHGYVLNMFCRVSLMHYSSGMMMTRTIHLPNLRKALMKWVGRENYRLGGV